MEDAYFFPYTSVGVVVGQKTSGVYRTTDAGATWTDIYCPNNRALYRVDFADSQTGYAVGEFGEMVKTTNGGLSWTNISTPSVFGNLYTVDFVTPQVGYVGGQRGLFKTINGGTSWTRISTDPIKSIAFWTVNDGFATSFTVAPFFRRTTDGGVTWQAGGTTYVRDLSCDRQGYCYGVIGNQLHFYDNPNPVGFEDLWTSEVVMYPNPAQVGQPTQYRLPEGLTYQVQIYSQTGVLVHEAETEGGTHLLPTSLARGLYLVRFSAAGKSYQQRLIIE